MAHSASEANPTGTVWSVVLAGGEGRRLRPVTADLPKQFWAPAGHPTLVEQTIGRLGALSPAARTITVVDRSHRRLVTRLTRHGSLGSVVYQPGDRGTAAGVLLGVSAVARRDPEAIVVITPSDHGVERPAVFLAGLTAAIERVRHHAEAVMLLGVEPDSPESDYGWIVPAPRPAMTGDVAPVAAFVEKPDGRRAERLFRMGAVWNTMVLVARCSRVIELIETRVPAFRAVFERVRARGGRSHAAWLAARYPTLPVVDFSRDILGHAAGLTMHVWPASLGWTDLGTPERLRSWSGSDAAPGGRRGSVPFAAVIEQLRVTRPRAVKALHFLGRLNGPGRHR